MGKALELTGKRFGRLTVIRRVENNRHHMSQWECECDCGTFVVVIGTSLTIGHTKSCGCLWRLPVNHDFFKTWTPEMAWVLGFWAADGCVSASGKNGKRISFAQKDKRVLQKIKQLFESEHKIKGTKNCWCLAFASNETYKDLCLIFGTNNLHRKSLTLTFPDVNHPFLKDFVRGCIDGDGYLALIRGKTPFIQLVSGSETFADGFIDAVFQETGIVFNKNRRRDAVAWNIECAGIKAKSVAAWAYYDSCIALERKYRMAKKLLKWKSRRIQLASLTPKMFEMFQNIIPESVLNRYLEREGLL